MEPVATSNLLQSVDRISVYLWQKCATSGLTSLWQKYAPSGLTSLWQKYQTSGLPVCDKSMWQVGYQSVTKHVTSGLPVCDKSMRQVGHQSVTKVSDKWFISYWHLY